MHHTVPALQRKEYIPVNAVELVSRRDWQQIIVRILFVSHLQFARQITDRILILRTVPSRWLSIIVHIAWIVYRCGAVAIRVRIGQRWIRRQSFNLESGQIPQIFRILSQLILCRMNSKIQPCRFVW